jgi:hypothetical protein
MIGNVCYTTDEGLFLYQIKEKAPPRLSFRDKIGILTVVGATAYIFRDDLCKWSNRNDKASHLFLSYGMSELFGWKFAAGFMLAIEATQIDIFGISGRYEDTAADLFLDGIGITVGWRF